MGISDKRMNKQAYLKDIFQQHQTAVTIALLFLYFLISSIINANAVLMEGMRQAQLPFLTWEPYVWEMTSALSSFLVVLVLAVLMRVFPWNWDHQLKSLSLYFSFGLAFTFAHIVLMLTFRSLIYAFNSAQYNFATTPTQWLFELAYEMQKDVWSFLFFVVAIACYRYVMAQWLGDATNIKVKKLTQASDNERRGGHTSHSDHLKAQNHSTDSSNYLLLVKKLGKEFLINKKDIAWAGSSGNYVNLYVNGDVYPMRTTLTAFLTDNSHLPIERVHRSFAVNINEIDNIELHDSGDGVITLKSGSTVKMSRRYKLLLPQAQHK